MSNNTKYLPGNFRNQHSQWRDKSDDHLIEIAEQVLALRKHCTACLDTVQEPTRWTQVAGGEGDDAVV